MPYIEKTICFLRKKPRYLIFAASLCFLLLLLGIGAAVRAGQKTAVSQEIASETSRVTVESDLTASKDADGREIPYDNISYEEYKKAMADSDIYGEYAGADDTEEESDEDEDETDIGFDVAKVPMSERTSFLFPNGVPTSSSGCYSYTVKVTIPITNPDGSKGTTTLRVHKKLAKAVRAIFQELSDMNFPIASVGAYCYRKMASGTGHLSHHSYGVCIDLNAGYNPPSYWGSKPNTNSKFYCNEKVQAVFKKYGFYWGGNWSQRYYDPMHFTYTNH